MTSSATRSHPPVPIAQNLNRVHDQIAEAALRAGHSPAEVRLVAVSKTFPPAAIRAAYEAGQRDFGENRAEEGAVKITELNQAFAGAPPSWHMIGHIQSRKAPLVVEHFQWVHSIDRLSIAQKLSTLAVQAQRDLPVLLECNVSGEASKYGFQATHWEHESSVLDALLAGFAEIAALPALRICGLMTMAPLADNPEKVRPVFASLRRLGEACRQRFPELPWRELSMGMSGDFQVAVEEGATMVRIGQAIFGAR